MSEMAELTKRQLEMLESVRKNYKNFKRYKAENQFYELALEVVTKNAHMIEYVREDLRTEELCLIAVKQYPVLIRHVPNQTNEICDVFINSLFVEDYFHLIKNPTEEMALKAVKNRWLAIQGVPENLKTEEVMLEAIKGNPYAIAYISKGAQTERMALEAVKQNGIMIQYVENQTPELCMIAYQQNPESEKYFKI